MPDITDTSEVRAGRHADKPSDIPGRGWKAIIKRVAAEIKNDHLSLLAGGVAFKALLALFPAIVAAISIWALLADPQQIVQQTQSVTNALPADAAELLTGQMESVARSGEGTLSTALVVSIVLALWSASGGMAGLIEGTTAAYDEVDERPFPIKRGIALGLTLGAILFLFVALGLITGVPAAVDQWSLPETVKLAIRIAIWPVLFVLMMLALAFVYKVGADRDAPEFRWATWGAVIATVLWLIGSAGFTLYVNNFGKFGETYGSFAGIIVLMLWLFLTAFIILLGAEINAEMERQTRKDTTVGDPEPMGMRGADPADTTPEQARDGSR